MMPIHIKVNNLPVIWSSIFGPPFSSKNSKMVKVSTVSKSNRNNLTGTVNTFKAVQHIYSFFFIAVRSY